MLRDYEGTDLQVTHEFQFNTNGNVDQIVEPLRVCMCIRMLSIYCYVDSIGIPGLGAIILVAYYSGLLCDCLYGTKQYLLAV